MKTFLRAEKVLRSYCLPRAYRLPGCSRPENDLGLRFYHDDGRRRLSAFWVPTGGIAPTEHTQADSHSLLIRAGFVRQAHSGLFQFLPLGLRVQEKVEQLLDKHMLKLGASKLSLSTFSSEDLWKKTGRLDSNSSELFRLQDRKGGKYLLSPTHEEEITSLVGSIVKSYKELPLRLYQISRKYRDEPRPRQGLLRTREFLMKDLYTFDATTEQALQTYQTVRETYNAFFSEFKIPFLTAKASSGEIGGNLSHEYHFLSKKGDDNLVCCSSCDYVANEEVAESRITRVHRHPKSADEEGFTPQGMESSSWKQWNPESQADDKENQWLGISQDRSTLVYASLPQEVEIRAVAGKRYRKAEINPYAMKRVFPELDLGVEDPLAVFNAERILGTTKDKNRKEARVLRVVDMRYYLQQPPPVCLNPPPTLIEGVEVLVQDWCAEADKVVDLVRIDTGDLCPNCDDGSLKVESAVELGHTFHLGTRYSAPLEATIDADLSQKDRQREVSNIPGQSVTVQMGCHGIGVSRLIAAVADSLADSKGLNWPRVMAPFETIIIPTKGSESETANVYDLLTTNKGQRSQEPIDAILDDRKRDFGWKIKDADMIGYPIIVILGRDWKREGKCEVQCRRLNIKVLVSADDLKAFVAGLMQHL